MLESREVLRIQDLHAYYGESHILHGVNLTVREGEVVTLLGRNGAGRTTTIKSLLGLVGRRTGSIQIQGQETIDLQPHSIARLGLGYCPEERGIFSALSCEENLLLPPVIAPNGMSVQEIYEMFPNLSERRNSPGTRLSGGEQQMLVIGRALMGNPDVLLLDEPSEGLAPLIVHEVSKGISKLKEEGLSIILVEQNFSIAMDLADYFVVLNTGYVAYQGESSEVRANPELVTQHLGVF